MFFLSVFSVLITLLMFILKENQRKNKDLINTMRDSYEKQIYLMNDRLTASMDRWKDVNHLVIGSQVNQRNVEPSRKVHLSSFLVANGINKEDIKPEPDLVFILTPFNKRFDKAYDAIRKTCHSIGLRCLRGDEEFIRGDILPHILKIMCKANIVIANISGRNANVFYELGLAHAMDKNTLLVSKTVEELPLDVQSKKIIIYKNYDELVILLKDELLRLAFTKNLLMFDDSIYIDKQQAHIEDTILGALLRTKYRLFFNPNISGLKKTKIMKFGLNGTILEGRNMNESSWRISNNQLQLLNSENEVHSRFMYDSQSRRFIQVDDPESGSMKKHGINNQYMVPEE